MYKLEEFSMVTTKQQTKDPYEEIAEILLSYEEGLPVRTGDCEECSCHTSE